MVPHHYSPLQKETYAQQHHKHRAFKPERGHGPSRQQQLCGLHYLRSQGWHEQLHGISCGSQVCLESQVQELKAIRCQG